MRVGREVVEEREGYGVRCVRSEREEGERERERRGRAHLLGRAWLRVGQFVPLAHDFAHVHDIAGEPSRHGDLTAKSTPTESAHNMRHEA